MHWVQEQAEAAAAKTAAAAEQAAAKKAAAAAEKRRSTILTSMFAGGVTKPLAEHLALKTDMPAEQAVAALKIASTAPTRGMIPSLAQRVPQSLGTLGLMDREASVGGGSGSWDSVISKAWANRKAAAQGKHSVQRESTGRT